MNIHKSQLLMDIYEISDSVSKPMESPVIHIKIAGMVNGCE